MKVRNQSSIELRGLNKILSEYGAVTLTGMKSLFKNSQVVFPWGRVTSVRLLTDTCLFFFFNKLHWILKLNMKLHFKAVAWDSQPPSQLCQGMCAHQCAHLKGRRAFIKCSAKCIVLLDYFISKQQHVNESLPPPFFKLQLLPRCRAVWVFCFAWA